MATPDERPAAREEPFDAIAGAAGELADSPLTGSGAA
jgi:hypothetical protein